MSFVLPNFSISFCCQRISTLNPLLFPISTINCAQFRFASFDFRFFYELLHQFVTTTLQLYRYGECCYIFVRHSDNWVIGTNSGNHCCRGWLFFCRQVLWKANRGMGREIHIADEPCISIRREQYIIFALLLSLCLCVKPRGISFVTRGSIRYL